MQPENKTSEMDYKFEGKGENTVSVYTEDKNGAKNEIVQLHVMSEAGYALFREITSEIQPVDVKRK